MLLKTTKLPKDPVNLFFYTCSPEAEDFLREQWAECEQLVAADIPTDALPMVMLMACYATQVHDIDLVDDYEALRLYTHEHLGQHPYPHNYLLTFICQGHTMSAATWRDLQMQHVFETLIPLED